MIIIGKRNGICALAALLSICGCTVVANDKANANPDSLARFCGKTQYGNGKQAFRQWKISPDTIVQTKAEIEEVPPEQKIRVQATPLETPPEITRIQRGLVTYWAGAFINDGLLSWSGIDLDRMEAVNVQRHIYDKRAGLSHPPGEPFFPTTDVGSFARKWSDDTRTELEVVSRVHIDADTLQSFVCEANAVWTKAPQKQQGPLFTRMTDTFANDITLLDRRDEQGQLLGYSRRLEDERPFNAIQSAIWGNAPRAYVQLPLPDILKKPRHD